MHKLLIIILLTAGIGANAQEFSYIQYTVKDGLPGSIVYQSLQDKDGFIWFCTNQGVSRFDGKTFKNFSKEDGLPDNEILRLYLDRFGNVWFISLLGMPSVFYNGAIHKVEGCMGVFDITEDFTRDSIFLLSSYIEGGHAHFGYFGSRNTSGNWSFKRTVVTISKERQLDCHYMLRVSSEKKLNFYFSSLDPLTYHLKIQTQTRNIIYSFARTQRESYLPTDRKSFFSLSEDKRSLLFLTDTIYLADTVRLRGVFALNELRLKNIDLNELYCENDSALWICSRNRGLILVRNFLSRRRTIKSYFPDAFCTSLMKDREGGYWVTTHDDGVYYLPSLDSYYMSVKGILAGNDVKCIRTIEGHTLAAGFANGNILMIDYPDLKNRAFTRWGRENKNNRILDIRSGGNQGLLVACDYGLYLLRHDGSSHRIIAFKSIKGIFNPNDSVIVYASADGLSKTNGKGSVDKHIFSPRTTCVDGAAGHYYAGTLNGMYEFMGDSIKYWGNTVEALSGIINHIDVGPDTSIWVSTQQGVVILKNERPVFINKGNGLLSDMCKNVLISGNVAWISTDKGITRMSFHWVDTSLACAMCNITESDGLISNDVNQTAIGGGYVWAATARGISFFSANYSPHSMQNPLININSPDTIDIDYRNNKAVIELSGISFRSGKQISYQYRLKDLDSNWVTTASNLLEFSILPFGFHTFEARVIDRWGIRSNRVKDLFIRVRPPFWKTLWFVFSIYLLGAFLIGFLVYAYFKMMNWKKDKELTLRNKMANLEMMALRSQMNPHFIFNCLSSIQLYILHADVRNANLYLNKLSVLIRKILQNSANSYITLAEELSILGLYLELEKLRLTERMNYTIRVREDIQPERIRIPSLIIQPFVENAVKHGIAPLRDDGGVICIDFRRSGKYLVCTIDDNGIGIRNASGKKKEEPGLTGPTIPEHRSLGLSITQNRIDVINAIQQDEIMLKIIDKSDFGLDEHGTVIQMSFLL